MLFPGVSPLSSGMKVRFGRGPLILLFCIGFLFVVASILPQIFQALDPLHPYRGIRILPTAADAYHVAQVREVTDGYPGIGSPYLSAGKSESALRPVYPEQVTGMYARASGMDALSAMFSMQALLVLLLTLALTAFAFSVTNSPWISVLAAAVTLFGSALLSSPLDAINMLYPDRAEFFFLRFTVDLEMQWAFLWTILFLTCLSRWMQANRRTWLLGAASAFLVLVVSSDTAATFSLLVLLLLSGLIFVHRDLKRLADLAGFWMIVILISTPQLIHMYVLSEHLWYGESMQRVGLVLSHGPLLTGTWLAVFVAISLYSRHIWPRSWPLLPVLSIAALLAINQQVFTGYSLLPHRYDSLVIQPLASLFTVALALHFASSALRLRSLRIGLAGAVIFGVLLLAFVQQREAYRTTSQLWGRLQQAAPTITYIAQELRPGHTVYSQDEDILNILPAYTSADVTSSAYVGMGLVSTETLRNAYFFHLWLIGITQDQASKVFATDKRGELLQKIYGHRYSEHVGAPDLALAVVIEEEAAAYREYVQLSLRDKLLATPVSAVLTTPYDIESAAWITFLRCSKSVLSSGGYDVRIMKPTTDATSCMR